MQFANVFVDILRSDTYNKSILVLLCFHIILEINYGLHYNQRSCGKWNLSVRRVQDICKAGLISGAINLVLHGQFLMMQKNLKITELSQGNIEYFAYHRKYILRILIANTVTKEEGYMNFYLDKLTDEELFFIVRDDLGFFLEPIKQNGKNYIRYSSQLGTKKKDSLMVKSNLPRIAASLFKKKDKNYVKAMEIKADFYASTIMKLASETLKTELSQEDLQKFSDEQIAEMLNEFQDADGSIIDFVLLTIQLKLVGFENVEERIQNIKKLLGVEENQSDLEPEENNIDIKIGTDNNSTEQETTAVKRQKVKKLTPEEKAAKNKAAVDAKEKAKIEEQTQSSHTVEAEENPIDDMKSSVAKAIIDTVNKVITKPERKPEDEKVSRYIGVISIKSNYYNFTPIGIFQNGDYYSYSERELDDLLPKSNKHNINFYYNFWDDSQIRFMKEHFPDGQPVLLDCEIDLLEENRTATGELNATGYKINGVDGWNRGQITPLSGTGLYTLLPKEALLDEIETKRAIRVNADGLIEGEKVLVNLGDGFYAGPFQVKYAAQNNTYFIVLQATDVKQCIGGYCYSDCERVLVEPSLDVENWIGYNSWGYYVINPDATPIVKDFISDKALLESFKESLSKAKELDYANLDVEGIIQEVGESEIVGSNIPEAIKTQRIERIRKILSGKEELVQIYAESLDLIAELLLKNKDSMQTDALLSELLAKKPELLDKMQGVRAIQAKLDAKQAELDQLEAQYADTEARAKKILEDAKTERQKAVNSEVIIDDSISEKKAELDAILSQLEVAGELVELNNKRSKLQDDVKYYESHKAHLQNDARNLERDFIELINGYSEKMADITFDGYMSSKMLQAAAKWESKNDAEALLSMVSSVNDVQVQEMTEGELVDYLVKAVQISRPGYSKNTILNIITCASQGFLTVFSGMPGCGKTSICNIMSKVLGLNNYENVSENLSEVRRYIPVSVERGWTSKRDFIGYFNPLTKAFEESNREVYDGLRLLDMEQKKSIAKWPFFILLDEANLSPMEYYWADFMNVCDDLSDNSSINLGNDNVFQIPETLHFLATINNDHTTETLSPRLIDRAWVITLPKNPSIQVSQDIPNDQIKNVTWNEIKAVFLQNESDKKSFDRETQVIYESIKEKLSKQEMFVSPRVDIAIQKYWAVASKLMEEDEYGNSPSLVALDYAVAQKILPKIVGSGDEYEVWLDDLKVFCNNKGLVYSAGILSSIISRGNRQMKYYQFFN